MKFRTPGYIKRALMGHEALDEGEKSYAQEGVPPETLYEAVSQISYDLSMIWSPLPAHVEEAHHGLRVVK